MSDNSIGKMTDGQKQNGSSPSDARTGRRKSTFHVLQKQITRRRIWLAAAVLLYMILYYPVAIVMLIARAEARSAAMGYGPENTAATKLGEVSTWIGMRQEFAWVLILMGVIIAIQGYAWLFNPDKIDFYESQPVSRRQRFWNLYLNGFLIFWIPMAVCLLLSVLIAGAMGAIDSVTCGEALLQLVRNTLLFASSYSIGILAVMLTGNPAVCTLTAAFLLLIDQVYAGLIGTMKADWFSTYCYYRPAGIRSPAAMFSPVYNSLTARAVLSTSAQLYGRMTSGLLRWLIRTVLPGDLANLIVAAVLLFAAFRLYLGRRAEWAGRTVLFRPVSAVIRILVSVAAGLFAALLIYSIYGSDVKTSRGLQALVIAGLLIVTVITAGVTRVIHELNFWKFFAGPAEIVISAAAALLCFCFFRFDLSGFDRYVPAPDQVESAALYVYSDRAMNYPDSFDSTETVSEEDHIMETMVLTDVEGLEEITTPGMALRVQNDRQALSMTEEDLQAAGADTDLPEGWSADVCYRMKDGRKIYRSVLIPSSMDAGVLDRVTGSAAWRQSVFGVYDDAWIAGIAASEPERVSLSCSNGMENIYGYDEGSYAEASGLRTGNGTLYAAFAEAYRRDLLQYDYSLASSEEAPCVLTVQLLDSSYMTEEYPVYPSFANTIRFLKENRLYSDPPSAEDFRAVDLYCYDSSSDTGTSLEYTDPDQIRDILSCCSCTLEMNWKASSLFDQNFSITAYDRNGSLEYYHYAFRKGEVPAFVEEDLAKQN